MRNHKAENVPAKTRMPSSVLSEVIPKEGLRLLDTETLKLDFLSQVPSPDTDPAPDHATFVVLSWGGRSLRVHFALRGGFLRDSASCECIAWRSNSPKCASCLGQAGGFENLTVLMLNGFFLPGLSTQNQPHISTIDKNELIVIPRVESIVEQYLVKVVPMELRTCKKQCKHRGR